MQNFIKITPFAHHHCSNFRVGQTERRKAIINPCQFQW